MTPTGLLPPAPPDPRPALLPDALSASARIWLAEAATRIAAEPSAIRALFPAARRRCGHARLDAHWTTDEAARAVLLTALPLQGRALADEVAGLYRHGDPAEQRAVLRTLPLLGSPAAGPGDDPLGEVALSLVREALRGNDTSVIEAALGPYAAAHLPDAEYRQAVLKCVFYEIPLARIFGLHARTDAELARMLADFAHERIAAGRDVPPDIWPVVRPFPAVADAFATRAHSVAPTRRAAAESALAALRGDAATSLGDIEEEA
ncbi:EboA domain-containing protein [Streptomyces sp. NPDC001795]|uniref:EboA domain-containing protein n=1 Tax=unclassified Streptomyces TaxID=2593676 RepID=UPI003328EAD1